MSTMKESSPILNELAACQALLAERSRESAEQRLTIAARELTIAARELTIATHELTIALVE